MLKYHVGQRVMRNNGGDSLHFDNILEIWKAYNGLSEVKESERCISLGMQ